jgi:hypothetical protein
MTAGDRLRIAALVAATVIAATPLPAQAQTAEAEVLFRAGRKLMDAGKIAAACEKFAASERLESSVGTLLNLGDCQEQLGKLASAWASFKKAEATARRGGKDSKRLDEAKRRARLVELDLSMLTLLVPPESRIEGLVVRRGDDVVDGAMWGAAVPVDPGPYVISAEAPGRQRWQTEVTIAERSDRDTITIPRLERISFSDPESELAPEDRTANPFAVTRTERVDGGTFSTTRRLAIGVGVAGLGAIGGGIAYGIRARRFQTAADEVCPTSLCDNPDALAANDEAQDSALKANILFGVGGAGVAAAVVMWIVGAPDDKVRVRPMASDGRVGVTVGGSF